MTGDRARALIANSDIVLFDFDGPLCDVFANRPAIDVARKLEILADLQLPTDDPLEVLRLTFQLAPHAGPTVEDALIDAEVEAVSVAIPERDGVATLRALDKAGKRIGIVSNNSGRCVDEFLAAHGLGEIVAVVVGRAFRRPDLMKPDPWSLREALTAMQVRGETAIFIGDSMTDIEAARLAGIHCIAVANKPAKVAPFTATGVATVAAMRDLISQL